MKDPWADSPTEGWMIEVITKDQNKTKDKETAMDNLFMAVFLGSAFFWRSHWKGMDSLPLDIDAASSCIIKTRTSSSDSFTSFSHL